jgi:lipopolysaccharide transport system ATP-binding protein
MEEIASGGRTVLFVSHQLAAVQSLCNWAILLDGGKVRTQGRCETVIAEYVSTTSRSIASASLAQRTDRSGSGRVRFTTFHLEDDEGNPVNAVRSGDDAVLVFGYRTEDDLETVKGIDCGFSIHKGVSDQAVAVLYSSYQGVTFDSNAPEGSIRCCVKALPLPAGRYKVGGRLTVGGIEADWPADGIGFIDVVEGDFFGTGRTGFGGDVAVLIKGQWSCAEVSLLR